jgi:acyl-CoA reductase-like NAD-dependent aldehyde dehydrogenase
MRESGVELPPGTRCALEHGRAAPAIIDRSADLDRLIEPLAKGGYYHAGQVCVSVRAQWRAPLGSSIR